MTTKGAPLFETETCSRCGGTGQYSYNQIDGSRCFGCSGRKVRLTKRGTAAQNWYHHHQMKPLAELQVGDRVWEENFFAGYRAWFRVDRIEGDTVHVSYLRKHHTTRDEIALQGTRSFRVRPSDQFAVRWQQMVALAFQATLNKNGKPRRGRTNAARQAKLIEKRAAMESDPVLAAAVAALMIRKD